MGHIIEKPCFSCGEVFSQETRQGRPFEYCEECRNGTYTPTPIAPSFHGSRIKQARRDDILGYFKRCCPDPKAPISILTLPGEEALLNPESIENRILKAYEHPIFFFVEKNRKVAEEIDAQIEHISQWKNLRRGRVANLDMDTLDAAHLFSDKRFRDAWERTYDPFLPFDMIHLDWMGSFGRYELETVKVFLENKLLEPHGLFALTINASGRCRQTNRETLGGSGILEPQETAWLLQRKLMGLGSKYGYKFSPKSFATPYSCEDSSSKASPMVAAIMFGAKKQMSAY